MAKDFDAANIERIDQETIAIQSQQIHQLIEDNKALRTTGLLLVQAATHVAMEYDGVHRLMSEASRFLDTVANEGGRGLRHRATEEQPSGDPGTLAPDQAEQLRQLVADDGKLTYRLQYQVPNPPYIVSAGEWADIAMSFGTIEVRLLPEQRNFLNAILSSGHRLMKVETDAGI